MAGFLRRNWVWIVAPILVVAAVIGIVLWLLHDSAVSPFDYKTY